MTSRQNSLKTAIRGIDMDEIIDLHSKVFYYLDTFSTNRGRSLAKDIIFDCLKKDAVEEKMKAMRMKNKARIYRENAKEVDPYETAAQAFYRRYGTSGEF